MVDSARLGAVVDECTAGASELVVEGDACGEGAEAGDDAFSEAWEGAGAVAFEGEEVFAGPEDALDALADRREVWAVAGFVFAAWADEGGADAGDLCGELAAGVALVAQQDLAAVKADTVEELEADFAFVTFGEASANARGVPSGEKIACKRKPQKNRECEAQYP
jgi:hypothetical protein